MDPIFRVHPQVIDSKRQTSPGKQAA